MTPTPTRIDALLRDVRPEDGEKLRCCIQQEVARMGFLPSGVREGGRVWERARFVVARNLIQHEVTLADIEFCDQNDEVTLTDGRPSKPVTQIRRLTNDELNEFLCLLSFRQAATLTAIVDADFRSRGWRKTFESGPHYDATLLKVVSRLRAQDASLDDIAVQFEEARWERIYQ